MISSIVHSMNTKNSIYLDKKKEAWKIFDSIYKKYDLLNHVLSFGQDFLWRKRMVRLTKEQKDIKLLDVATGTGDVIISFLRNSKNTKFACGMDMSFNMMKYGKEKLIKRGFKTKWGLFRSDAGSLPLSDDLFDVVTIAFGIRNMPDPDKVLREMSRVLKPGGEILILEFSLPKNFLVKKLHLFYLRIFIPFLGKLISGNFGAYKYLDRTIESFPYGEKFLKMLYENGYKDSTAISLSFGAVTLYQGRKS